MHSFLWPVSYWLDVIKDYFVCTVAGILESLAKPDSFT